MVPDTLRVADLVVETHAQTVTRAGERVALTTKEFTLLEYLARNAGRVIGRAEIADHAWDDNYDPCSNLIEVYISRLRKKIDEPYETPLIHTRRGAGYRLGPAAVEEGGSESEDQGNAAAAV